MKAIWKGKVLAESDETVVVEGNHYFPEDSINKDISNRAKQIRFAVGKERRVITASKLTAKQTPMPHGIIPNRKMKRKRSKIT